MTIQSLENVSAGLVRTDDQLARGTADIATTGSARARANTSLLGLGRLLFGGYFIYNGVNHFANAEMMAGYAKSMGVPLAGAGVALTGAMLLAGGVSLLTGTRPKVGSALIAGFLLGVTPVMHRFWGIEDQQQRMQELVNFTKNAALLGAAGMAAAMPEPWPASVDGLIGTRRNA